MDGEEAGRLFREREGVGWRLDCDLDHPDWTTRLTFTGSPQREAWNEARSYLFHFVFGPEAADGGAGEGEAAAPSGPPAAPPSAPRIGSLAPSDWAEAAERFPGVSISPALTGGRG